MFKLPRFVFLCFAICTFESLAVEPFTYQLPDYCPSEDVDYQKQKLDEQLEKIKDFVRNQPWDESDVVGMVHSELSSMSFIYSVLHAPKDERFRTKEMKESLVLTRGRLALDYSKLKYEVEEPDFSEYEKNKDKGYLAKHYRKVLRHEIDMACIFPTFFKKGVIEYNHKVRVFNLVPQLQSQIDKANKTRNVKLEALEEQHKKYWIESVRVGRAIEKHKADLTCVDVRERGSDGIIWGTGSKGENVYFTDDLGVVKDAGYFCLELETPFFTSKVTKTNANGFEHEYIVQEVSEKGTQKYIQWKTSQEGKELLEKHGKVNAHVKALSGQKHALKNMRLSEFL